MEDTTVLLKEILTKLDSLEKNVNALSDDLSELKKHFWLSLDIRPGKRSNRQLEHLIHYLGNENFQGQSLTNEQIYYALEEIIMTNAGVLLSGANKNSLDVMFEQDSDSKWVKKDKKLRENYREKNLSTWLEIIDHVRNKDNNT